jgi:putative salt-induced outer membrane protein YdiY
LNQTSEKFFQRFNGAINSGIIYSKGNHATQYNIGSDVQYVRERWSSEASFSSNLSSNSGSTTSTRNQLGLRSYHLLPWENYFYAGVGNFIQSSVQGITLQTTLGGGIGRFFMNTNHTSVAVLFGLGWQGTDYRPSATTQGRQNVAAALIEAQIKLFKFKKTNLGVTANLLPDLSDPGHFRFDTNASYYVKLFSNLSWNASFYGNWDNRPPPGFAVGDYGTSSGLSWTFGNR